MHRRRFFADTVSALSSVALVSMLERQGLLADEARGPLRPQIDAGRPFAVRPTHFPAKARNVLVIFCSGACSQIDTFDYKPELIRRHGEMVGRVGVDVVLGPVVDVLPADGDPPPLTRSRFFVGAPANVAATT